MGARRRGELTRPQQAAAAAGSSRPHWLCLAAQGTTAKRTRAHLRLHVEAAHHHTVFEAHAGTQRPKLVRQLERQLAAAGMGRRASKAWVSVSRGATRRRPVSRHAAAAPTATAGWAAQPARTAWA